MNFNMLNVTAHNAMVENNITSFEYHTYLPYTQPPYNNNDEIRIPVHQTNICTFPSDSYLHVSGYIYGENKTLDVGCKLISNFVPFFFDEIRYELCNTEVDRVRNPGIVSTIKNYISMRKPEVEGHLSAGIGDTPDSVSADSKNDFNLLIPLRLLLGVFEDYKRIIVHAKQELVLLRASTDKNAVLLATGKEAFSIQLTKIGWRIPHVTLADEANMELLKTVDSQIPLYISFRRWQLYDYPLLPKSNSVSWTVKSIQQTDKPRYIIVGFQTNRRNNVHSNAALFDSCNVTNVKLYLNSVYYPYENLHGDSAILYEMYKRFYQSYYHRSDSSPLLSWGDFGSKALIYVIDCSKQSDTLKAGTVDIRLEFEARENFPDQTAAYCLIFNDCEMEYVPAGDIVRPVSYNRG